MPKITGTVLWKTIAPVMLPRAKVSFPSRTHRTELIFSGSSVASGASMRATSPAGRPMVSAVCLTASTKTSAPTTMSARASSAWATTAHHSPRRRRRPEAPQREALGDILQRAAGVEGPADVVGVGDEQEDGEPDPHEQGQLHDTSGCGHGEEDKEEADVAGYGLLVDDHVFARRLAPGELLADARCPAADLHPLLPALAVDDRGGPCHEHRQRGEQERRAEDGPDPDLPRHLSPLAAEDRS